MLKSTPLIFCINIFFNFISKKIFYQYISWYNTLNKYYKYVIGVDNMYGIALEGGGARGAYHIGALKALVENGYKISGIVGTSIGAFNGAIFAQGDFEKLYKCWTNLTSSDLFNIDKKDLHKIVNKKIDAELIKNVTEYVKVSASNKGMDVTKYKEILDNLIDEEKLRKSKIDFGLATVSLTDKKTVELYKEDIDEGMIASYIMASSQLPVFKSEKIQEKLFLDGGFYNNCPVNMLIQKEYKDIIEIRTKAIGVYKKIKTPKDVNMITIAPSSDLGSILFADEEIIRKNVKMGYYDALKVIKGLVGNKYYINRLEDNVAFNIFMKLDDNQIYKIAEDYVKNIKEKEAKKVLFENILFEIAKKLKLQKVNTYNELLVGMVEYLLSEEEIVELYKVYDLKELILEIKKISNKLLKKEKSNIVRNYVKEMIIKLIQELNIEMI